MSFAAGDDVVELGDDWLDEWLDLDLDLIAEVLDDFLDDMDAGEYF